MVVAMNKGRKNVIRIQGRFFAVTQLHMALSEDVKACGEYAGAQGRILRLLSLE